MMVPGAEDRHPAVRDSLRRFDSEHLTDPDARQIAMECARLAALMLTRIRRDDPDLTAAFRDLANARDGFIRAKIYEKQGH